MSEQSSEPGGEQPPRDHPQDPSEGADAGSAADSSAREPQEQPQAPAEGADDPEYTGEG